MEVLFMYVQALQPWLIQRSREKNGELAKAYPHCIGNIWFMGAKNVLVEIINTIIKRWADPAIPFYMRYYLNFCLETFRKDSCPTSRFQIDVGQIKCARN